MLLIDHLRQAIAGAPRAKLPEVSQALYRAWANGEIDDADGESLAASITLRQAAPAVQASPRRPVGARPRTPESLERRRKLASAGYMPPHLAAHFTEGERAVLAVVAGEVLRRRSCALTRGELAARAGVSETVVKTASRQAAALGLLTREERRISKTRNDTTILRVVSPEWNTWLDRRGSAPAATLEPRRATQAARGGGGRQAPGTSTFSYSSEKSADLKRKEAFEPLAFRPLAPPNTPQWTRSLSDGAGRSR